MNVKLLIPVIGLLLISNTSLGEQNQYKKDVKIINDFYNSTFKNKTDFEKANSDKIENNKSYSGSYADEKGVINFVSLYGKDSGYWKDYCKRNNIDQNI